MNNEAGIEVSMKDFGLSTLPNPYKEIIDKYIETGNLK